MVWEQRRKINEAIEEYENKQQQQQRQNYMNTHANAEFSLFSILKTLLQSSSINIHTRIRLIWEFFDSKISKNPKKHTLIIEFFARVLLNRY